MEEKILEQADYPRTGGRWQASDDGVVSVILGGRRASDGDVISEAQWFVECLRSLHDKYPKRTWTALVDLKEVPEDHRPPREASERYTHMLRDEELLKVALLHATTVQKAIVAILLAPAFLADKVHYFANTVAARDWLLSEHPNQNSINW